MFDPEDWIAWSERDFGRTRPHVPANLIFSVIPSHLDIVSDRFWATPDLFFSSFPIVCAEHQGAPFVLATSPKESYAAGGLDLLITLGARRVIIPGGTGALTHDIACGELIVATRALRDESQSFHYLPPSRYVGRIAGTDRTPARSDRR